MSNYFKEAQTVNQNNYGKYCNNIRAFGLNPVPYHVFTSEMSSKTKAELKDQTVQYWKDNK